MNDQALKLSVGQRVRCLRAKRPQRELAAIAGCTQAALSNYENGFRMLPLLAAARLADAYGISIKYFVPDEALS